MSKTTKPAPVITGRAIVDLPEYGLAEQEVGSVPAADAPALVAAGKFDPLDPLDI